MNLKLSCMLNSVAYYCVIFYPMHIVHFLDIIRVWFPAYFGKLSIVQYCTLVFKCKFNLVQTLWGRLSKYVLKPISL
jgi:hypothetical protein